MKAVLLKLPLLAACALLFAGCQYIQQSKPLPATWPLNDDIRLATTNKVVNVIEKPQEKLWAVFFNVLPNKAQPRDSIIRSLEKQGYKPAIAPTQDLRKYEIFMISKDGVYYATLASGNDGSYPTPTTFKAQWVLEVVSVQHHRMRLGI